MPITVPDTVRCAIQGRWTNGHNVTCVVDYIVGAPLGGDFGGAEVAETVGLAWRNFVMPNLLDNYSFQGVQWTDLSSTTGTTGFWAPDALEPNVGGGTNSASQPATAVLFKKTGTSGRGARSGRMYWPPPAEAQVDENGVIDSVQLANYQLAARRFLAQNTAPESEPTYRMGVVHFDQPRPPKGTEDNRTGTVTPVLDLVAQPVVATQRRRLR